MRVLKFGGKSLSSKEKMQKICKFIKKIYKNDKNLIIIVSAMGTETDDLEKIGKIFGGENFNKTEMAKLLSTGETKSSALFALMLNHMNVKAKSFSAHELEISAFGDPLNSKIAYINKSKLQKYLEKDIVCVVAGFQGTNKNGEICTLGRGGSDTTAAAIASIFEVDAEIYSDFDGIFAGDPRELNFKKLKQINYEIMKLMANSGSKVLDERATNIAENHQISILAKSSTNPNKTGSEVCQIENDVTNITCINYLCQVNIIFSNQDNINFILKSVFFCLNNQKYYNFNIQNNKISFFVPSENKTKIVYEISKKLNLLKTN